jgi:uncharacterized membrane protein YoaK (UPF0700 family)
MERVTLHDPDEIFSSRHVPSWLMLAFASGYVNSSAFVACERFVTHVTGTATQVGVQVASLGVLLDFALVLAFFVFGAMASAVMINGRAHRHKRPLYTLPLLIVAIATATIALTGHAGLLGPFGGSVDDSGDFILLSVLSFVSGLQNAAVATSTGLLVRTTHLTGPATDLGIHLVEVAYTTGEDRKKAIQHALLRAGKIFSFVAGAIVGFWAARSIQYLAFLVPSAIVLVATGLSFGPARVREIWAQRRRRALTRHKPISASGRAASSTD